MTVRELRTLTGLTQAAFSKKYHIPKRTLENWEGGQRSPSETILYLLERAVKEDYKMKAKMDKTTKLYKDVFGIKENHENVNKFMKAIIINFGDERGDIIVENDNFGTRRKYADFTEGKKKAGLHPGQIVFSGIESAKILHERYIDKDGNVQTF